MRMRMLKSRRAGFTLIELLVVISIIAILAALTASAVFRVSGGQGVRRTESNIAKIAAALDQQWQAVLDQTRKETEVLQPNISLFQNAGNDRERALVVWTKVRLKMEFPQTFAEARSAIRLTDGSGALIKAYFRQEYVNYLAGAGSGTPEQEAAVCLYMALTLGRGGQAGFDAEQALQGAVSTISVGGRNFKVFVDSWGTPITFVRWPRGSADLNASPYVSNSARPDPQDPSGKLNNFFNANLEALTHPFNPPRNLVPVIISAGKDKQYGIDAVLTPTNASQESDNLYSYRLRKDGGRGN